MFRIGSLLTCLFLHLCVAWGQTAASRFLAIPTEEKVKDRDLSFCVTFDKKTPVADLALGDARPLTFKENLEFRTFPGFDLQNAFDKRDGEQLRYSAVKNIAPRSGAITMWLMARNYSPKDVQVSDPVKCHKSYFHALLSNKGRWVHLYFYQYYDDNRAMFYWHSSAAPPNGYKLAVASLSNVRQGEWFQLAGVWDEKEIRIYLNGELQSKTLLPPESLLPEDFTPAASESFVEPRGRLWEGSAGSDAGKDTVIDDVKIYSRPLTDIEIRNQYRRLARADVAADPMVNIDVELNGVDDGIGELDRLEAIVDFSPLGKEWQEELAKGKLRASYALTTPSGKVLSDEWVPSAPKNIRVISGVSEPGEYVFTATATSPRGKTETATRKMVRPDTSWYRNQIGLADTVPSPWTPMRMGKNNIVSVWNREYYFGNNPLPQKVVCGGESLLARPPELVIMTPSGKAEVAWTVQSKTVKNSFVEFQGAGKAAEFTIAWKTKVEFDGFIRVDFTIHGAPLVDAMRLEWTVKRKYCDYVLDPLLAQAGHGTYAAAFPATSERGTVLWLTSKSKGFCWAPENDANWVYDPKNEKPIRAIVTEDGGACSVSMVTRPVRMSDGASYHAMFIATPSRPLPKRCRTYRLGGYGRFSNCDVAMIQHVGEGTESIFTLKPGPKFDEVMDFYLNPVGTTMGSMTNLAIYGSATGLNDYCAEGRYFRKYWEIPGGPVVPFPVHPGAHPGPNEQQCLTFACDPRTAYSDYILWNLKQLFERPKQRYVAVYYDLCNNYLSANPLNGARFKDSFGREVNSLVIMGLRRHLLRTMRYCHETGRDTIYHAHSYYNPMIHAFGDYWYPGEQYCDLIQRQGSPYVYSDSISDNEYRCELNMHVKGSGILFLGNLQRANANYGTTEQTIAMCTKLLLNDVPMAIAFEDGNVINTIWGVFQKYHLDDAEWVPYYEPANRVRSSNRNIVASYYRCPDGRILLVVGNISPEKQTAMINLAAFTKKLTAVREEFYGNDLPVSENRISLTIPARHFRLIGF